MPTAGKGRAAGTNSVYHCGRPHQVAALALVAATSLITRAFFSPCPSPPPAAVAFAFASGGGGGGDDVTAAGMSWPSRVNGTKLDLKIYVYEESEIDGLGALMRGREGRISPDSCIKGQWGTQGDRTDKRDTSAFNTWKDIIIPGNVDDGMTRFDGEAAVQILPMLERKYLANFLGRPQGKVGHLQLVELAKKFPTKLGSPELRFSGPDKLGRIEYFQHLRNAKFCLAPRGESSWTL